MRIKNGCADVMLGKMRKRTDYFDSSTHRKQPIELLEEINVLCRDDGKKFDKDKSQRVKVIKEKIRKTDYKLTKGKIFFLP